MLYYYNAIIQLYNYSINVSTIPKKFYVQNQKNMNNLNFFNAFKSLISVILINTIIIYSRMIKKKLLSKLTNCFLIIEGLNDICDLTK